LTSSETHLSCISPQVVTEKYFSWGDLPKVSNGLHPIDILVRLDLRLSLRLSSQLLGNHLLVTVRLKMLAIAFDSLVTDRAGEAYMRACSELICFVEVSRRGVVHRLVGLLAKDRLA